MATVKVKDGVKPSEQIIADANRTVDVVDSKGRTLTLRRMNLLDEFRLMEALGQDLARNNAYYESLMPLMHVSAIDGETLAFPGTKRQIEAHIQLVGREGLGAVMQGIQKLFPESEQALTKDEKVGNADGTPV